MSIPRRSMRRMRRICRGVRDDVSKRRIAFRAGTGGGADHHSYIESAAVSDDRMAADEVFEADAAEEPAADSHRADDLAGDAYAGGAALDIGGGASGAVAGRAGEVFAGA